MQTTETDVVTGYAQSDSLKVYYEIHGGPLRPNEAPFVLLHGGMMAIETAFERRNLLPGLAALGRPVVAVEMQGHGHTADRDGPASIERLAADLPKVLDHLDVAQAHFVGHSLGGMAATGVAIAAPQRVASLTAVSVTYNLDRMLPELAKMQRDPSHAPSEDLIPLLPTEADFEAWTSHYQRVSPDPAAFETVLTKLNVMLAEWQGWTNAQLAAITAPTLLIIGDKDFTRIEHAADMKRLIPGARLAVLPDTTHMSIIDRGDWIAPMVAALVHSHG